MKTEVLTELNAQVKDWPIPVSAAVGAGTKDARKSVTDTIEAINFGAELYQEVLDLSNYKTTKEELYEHLKDWLESLWHAIGIIRSELKGDSALMDKLRFTYKSAVQAAIAASAKALNTKVQDLYELDLVNSVIHEWGKPGTK
jgi:hypothetical protein